jgi:peptide/nickel transport system substrate-binding protein
MRRQHLVPIALLATCALVAGACGGDDDADSSGDDAVTEATDEPADEPTTEPTDEPADEPATEPTDEPADEPATETTADTADGEYNPVGTLRIGNRIAVNTLNPFDDQTPATFSFYAWTYEGLVRQDVDGSFVPWLAEGWAVSDDGMTITFTLHDGVTFHDGEPFNADAVRANIDFVKTGPADQVIPPVAGQMSNVSEVEVIDDLTVVFHLATPSPTPVITWLARNSGFMVSPNALGNAGAEPIGTGPYIFNDDESSADLTHLVFDANPDYWRPADVGVERVEMDVVNDNPTRRQAFEAGQYDLVTDNLALGPPSVGQQIIGPATIISFTVVDWQGEVIAELADKDIRCAMVEAMNREGIVAQLGQSPESVRYQYQGDPSSYAYIDDLDVPRFDIESAVGDYEAAGGAGFSFGNGYLGNTQFETASVAWAGALNELGITMANEALDPPSGGEMFGAFLEARYPIQTIPINEPSPLLTLAQRALPDGTLNPSGAVPDGVQELVESALAKSPEDAEADVEGAWKIMLEECIWIPVFVLEDGWEAQDAVTGVERVPGIPLHYWPQGVRVDGRARRRNPPPVA